MGRKSFVRINFVDLIIAPESVECLHCRQHVSRRWTAKRYATDLSLSGISLLKITVGVYQCLACKVFFRNCVPFLRKKAKFTNSVVNTAIAAVIEDGMAVGRVPRRMERDFGISLNESTVRFWIATIEPAQSWDSYKSNIQKIFSGILCVDEMYQGNLAFLFAVDPAAPNGDKLIAYQLIKGKVLNADIRNFLQDIRSSGIEPDQVVTDGSPLYPEVVNEIWPKSAHQLCLFHKTHRLVEAVSNTYNRIKSDIPKAPTKGGGGITAQIRTDGIEKVRDLRAQGKGIREIARLTGHSRNTVKKWLADQTFVKRHLKRKTKSEKSATAGIPQNEATVPAPWESWDQVRTVKEQLALARPLMARRSDELSSSERKIVDDIICSPIGYKYNCVSIFVQTWYGIWRDRDNSRRAVEDARVRWEAFASDRSIDDFPSLVRFQNTLNDAMFERLSHHLRNPAWEATSNGAERFCRKVRHIQSQHYCFRTEKMIRHIIDRTVLTI